MSIEMKLQGHELAGCGSESDDRSQQSQIKVDRTAYLAI
jgi:hypothetical protein